MITIDPHMAQEIVDRTMGIIPFNVNVMDTRGIIVGSGKASRIGELHAGAQLALARKQSIEIDEATAKQLAGVKPGVNLPLYVRGQLCGVIGLTGHPDAVRQFGELVRVTAEMILEQSQLIGELQREKRYREEFVFHLVKPGGTSHADLEAWANRLDVRFPCLRSVVIYELTDARLHPDLARAELQRLQVQLASRYPELLMSTLSPRELVLLREFTRPPEAAEVRQYLREIATGLRPDSGGSAVIAVGVALEDIEGIPISYQSARRTLAIGRGRHPQETLFSYYDLSLPVLLAGLQTGWQAGHLRQPLERLDAVDNRQRVLRTTLAAWFAHDGQPGATARALGIHRNTLDYRLQRIRQATALNLERMDDRLLLYVALQLEWTADRASVSAPKTPP